ncbi:MAG: hypothetical protein P4L43_12470 [Syntrophobacteraceae bacterium]|nr:hypothetical protein [Syntrophobacteraceae bacterium]
MKRGHPNGVFWDRGVEKREFTLDDGYRAMAADGERESEALEWCDALAKDMADEPQ